MARLFIALQPSLADRSRLESRVPASLAWAGQRPIKASNFHMTLCFLGDTDEAAIPVLLSLVPQLEHPVRLVLNRLDYWPRPHVLCALPARDAGREQAVTLAGRIGSAVRRAKLAMDTKPFRPHVTLLHGVRNATLRAEKWPQALSEPVAWDCDRVQLMRSDPGPEGSVYRIVHE